jgi:membrane-bound lytic murein transglycosylase D
MIRNHLFCLLIALLISGCASSPTEQLPVDNTDTALVTPLGLEPQIEFWRKVYSHWSQGQSVLHDDRHLQLIYAELTLPGPVTDHYTSEQRAYVAAQRKLWHGRLAELERRLLAGEALNPAQQALADFITEHAGPQAVYGAADRLRSQRGVRERFHRGLAISGRYDAAFRRVFHDAGLPEDLAFLPHVESSFQAHARSSAGATGMWQFTRGAAQTFMIDHPALDERLDPVASARGAARYLSTAYRRLGSWPLALTSYNHGINGMSRARDRFGDDFVRIVNEYDHRLFGFASRNFYAEFLAAREVARHPQRYFPEGVAFHPPLNGDGLILSESLYAHQLAHHFGLDRSTLIALNPAWTAAAATGRVSLPVGTAVWLPAGTLERGRQLSEPVLGFAPGGGPQAY